jgi:hypothetical protein
MKVKIYMVLGFLREKKIKSLVTLNFGNLNIQDILTCLIQNV